jgi:hypothetical protein
MALGGQAVALGGQAVARGKGGGGVPEKSSELPEASPL